MSKALIHLQPNKFFLSRNTAPHVGDRIEFATHPNRSLPIQEATELVAALIVLIDDDKAVGKEVGKLRPDAEE